MLIGLLLTDFAIAKKVEVAFNSNLIVITGETGAGKTILMKAISAGCGGPVSGDVIRSGSESARVEVSFTINNDDQAWSILKSYELLDEEDLVILTRVVTKNRTKAIINGHFVPLKILSRVGRSLIDMHGQHDVQSLLNPNTHIDVLDRFGGKELFELRSEVELKIKRLNEVVKRLVELKENDKKYSEEREFIAFEIKELEDANLSADEEESLLKEEKLLSNAQELSSLLEESRLLLSQSENGSLIDLMEKLSENLLSAARISEEFSDVASQSENVVSQLKDIDRSLSEFASDSLFDPKRLAEVQERLSFLSTLKIKYKRTIPELISYLQELKDKLSSFNSLDERIEALDKERRSLTEELSVKCKKLSILRRTAAERFEKLIKGELADLAMENAQFKVLIKQVPDKNGLKVDDKVLRLFSNGIDKVEFLIAPNPGEGFKPLSSIASGGELSRVMLAIKHVIAEVDNIPTLAFDEVDAGIGGKTGEKVARKLLEISRYRQVICITHLPQIASLPAEHFVVNKEVKGGETYLTVKKLGEKERIEEIARMISGSNITHTTIKQAKELIRRWV